jgi:hypothetical protein
MRLESARDLKQSLMSQIVTPIATAVDARALAGASARRVKTAPLRAAAAHGIGVVAAVHVVALGAQPLDAVPKRQRTIALGITSGRQDRFKLAIRVQRSALLHSDQVKHMVANAKGEADVRVIGRVDKRPARTRVAAAAAAGGPWYQSNERPLLIGSSVGHFLVTAGTLGCFVRGKGKKVFMLSNNHVLANEDNAKAGDAALQPGRYDGGQKPKDAVAALDHWVKLKLKSPNRVDCAVAALADPNNCDPYLLRGILAGSQDGKLVGMVGAGVLDEGLSVRKVGRTTGATAGRVTAFEVDNVVVNYGVGNLRFDGQIEIESTGTAPFSDGGDSGSLIVTDDGHALALLFAGSETGGGANGLGVTYANPLDAVLSALNVSLV